MDFYILLGVNRDASLVDVKRAYRRLARRFHPDVNPGDDAAALRFREIAQAYAILSDPERRRRYDAVGYEAPGDPAETTGFEGFDFSAAVHANQQSTFGDLFSEVFRQEGPSGASTERGADLHGSLAVSFLQSMHGGEHRLPIVRQDACRDCAGTGVRSVAAARCPACQGSGRQRSARGHMVFTRACPRCRGTGLLAEQACASCGGLGRVARGERVAITFQPGIADGARVRVAGKGHAGRFGGPPGDLYVTVHVEPHPLFRREGDDVHLVVPIAVHEAALGTRLDVPALEGSARVRVPPGTQSGQRFRLRGRGAPSPRDGRRGDLIVEVRVVLPRMLDERSRALLREFGTINGESVREEFDQLWRQTAGGAGPDPIRVRE